MSRALGAGQPACVTERGLPPRAPHVAVIGDGDPRGPDAHRILEWAEEVGQLLARAGATVVTGGHGRRHARGVPGRGRGRRPDHWILPGSDAAEANEYVQIPIPTGLGVARNLVVVTAADAVLAVGGRHGTLSEIGLALRQGRHVVTLVVVADRLGAPHGRPPGASCARSPGSGAWRSGWRRRARSSPTEQSRLGARAAACSYSATGARFESAWRVVRTERRCAASATTQRSPSLPRQQPPAPGPACQAGGG